MKYIRLIPCLFTFLAFIGHAQAQGTSAFTYQGRLLHGGNPANGLFEMSFTLYDALTNGSAVGAPASVAPVAISNGLFTVSLDFGASPFMGAARWLEITVTVFGSDQPPVRLQPRQPITPTPYALHASNAANLMSFANMPLDIKVEGQRALRLEAATKSLGTAPNVIGGSEINFVLAGVVGATIGGGGATIYDGGPHTNRVEEDFGTVGGGQGNLSSGFAATVGGGAGNTSSDNSATVSGGAGNISSGQLSTIGGGTANRSGALGTTVAGGAGNTSSDAFATIGGGENNASGSAYSTVGGGGLNRIHPNANAGTIGGGFENLIEGGNFWATISGGGGNGIRTNAPGSSIGGGIEHIIRDAASFATIGGGLVNIIGVGAANATIGGGGQNRIHDNAASATIAGGFGNTNGGEFATVSGGTGNVANAASATIGGGSGNTVGSDSSFSSIGGGERNAIAKEAWNNTIGGGEINLIGTQTDAATIGGGAYNAIGEAADAATIGGGTLNTNSARVGTIAGGERNRVRESAEHATIGGGIRNVIEMDAEWATISGGGDNTVSGQSATVGGGEDNLASSGAATVGGGFDNTASGGFATVGGGWENTASGDSATVPGGHGNTATNNAFAAGSRAKAIHSGAFVWGDASNFDFASSNINEFAARATGGARFISAIDMNGLPTAGVALAPGSGSWSTLSDRNAKENFSRANGREILEKVAALPLATWNYKAQDKSIRHIGPMAQDFKAAFDLGENETTITTVDADGVALAAIQGLNQKLEEQLKAKEAQIEVLQMRMERLEKLLNGLGAHTQSRR